MCISAQPKAKEVSLGFACTCSPNTESFHPRNLSTAFLQTRAWPFSARGDLQGATTPLPSRVAHTQEAELPISLHTKGPVPRMRGTHFYDME